jgi:diguanylate cyclase (GGDEF)-like protein/PAS domain S-box-containing protein
MGQIGSPIFHLSPLMKSALDSTPVGLVVLDQSGATRHVNKRAAQLLGLVRASRKTRLPRLLANCTALNMKSRTLLASAFENAQIATRMEIQISLDGNEQPRVIAVDVRPAERSGWVMTIEDVTQTRQAQDWLLEHVSTDAVTRLPNRQHFMLMLHHIMTSSQGDGAGPAVLLINLHRFKLVNDTLGTEAGDMLLRQVGDRIATTLREDDHLARTAGNEFAVAVARGEGRPAVATRASALLEKLFGPYVVDGQNITLGAKIGIAHAPEHGHTAESLMANAGLALQDVQISSPVNVRFFDTDLTERAQRRRGLEADLRRAVENREFSLHYQAQVDVHRACVTGLEALIRWHSPTRGMVSPVDFIPLAEEIGLIGEIGDWVLQDACREAMRWPDEITVAVNASPLQIEAGDFAQKVTQALSATGLPAQRLEIEITENLLLRDTGTVMDTLAAIQGLGVRLVLDDFGTGYASLSQLSRFHFDKIKIDRSFVSPTHISAETKAIVRSIAALAYSLGIPSTAEGVETKTQLDQITADGCTCVQGYYLSRPVPANAVAEVLTRLHHPEARVAA